MIADVALALAAAWWAVTLVAVVLVRQALKDPQRLMAAMMRRKQPVRGVDILPVRSGTNG